MGFKGIELLSEGKTPIEVKEKLLEGRSDLGKRQLAIVDYFGASAAFTGSDTINVKSEIVRKDFVVTANMMVDTTTAEMMVENFESTAGKGLDLSERLLRALEAGDKTPGDKRGRQSASLQVFFKDDFPFKSIRVDVHDTPVQELRRIYEVCKIQIFPITDTFSKFSEIKEPAIKELGERPSILTKSVNDR